MAGQTARLENYNLAHVHFVGIGGARQAALAGILLQMGGQVSGSDLIASAATFDLAAQGVKVSTGHTAANVAGATLVVTTPAAPADNSEIAAAQAQNTPVIKNAELLGAIANAKRCIAVAGTHGKTTTTAMVAHVLRGVGLDPTFVIGGVASSLGTAGYLGKGEFAVIEADEYDRSFLQLEPQVAIITNIEADHLDYYGDFKTLQEAFREFADNVRPEGRILLCGDDDKAVDLALSLKKDLGGSTRFILYGTKYSNEWRATDMKLNQAGGYNFLVWHHYGRLTNIRLSIPGMHNVLNALAALALCRLVAPQINPDDLARQFESFRGVARRFEVKGDAGGITIVDDYAHHPTEIKATLKAARARYPERRIVALFQPHTYSRTKDLLKDFGTAFGDADIVRLMEIFPSRETDTLGISSADVLSRMNHAGKSEVALTHDNATQEMLNLLEPGDVFLTLGAGDVWKVGDVVLEALESA